jgi:hypothetical protein
VIKRYLAKKNARIRRGSPPLPDLTANKIEKLIDFDIKGGPQEKSKPKRKLDDMKPKKDYGTDFKKDSGSEKDDDISKISIYSKKRRTMSPSKNNTDTTRTNLIVYLKKGKSAKYWRKQI